MVLVDSSIWIATFKKDRPLDLGKLVEDLDDVVTCLPVVQEVLQGFRDEQAFRIAREAMRALPTVESPLTAGLFDEAVELYRTARRAGYTPRSSVDCLIAACAIRHDLTVLHRDRDFDVLARVSLLRQRSAS